MHSNTYSPKRAKKCKKLVKKWQKCQKITNNCKISEITKYGEKMTNIDKNVKQCKQIAKNGPKTAKKWENFRIFFVSFFWLETT